MILGAHRSTSGGLWKAVESGRAIDCDAVQLFTRPPQRWAEKPLLESDIELFRQALADYAISPVVAHDIYLTNLASSNDELREKSIQSCIKELQRCAKLGIEFLVMHCGSHDGSDEERAIERFSAAVQHVLDRSEQNSVKILLETTAGQGKCLGWKFEHISTFLDQIDRQGLMGVCLDTSHVFAAGYDISSIEGYRATMKEFDAVIGLDRLLCIHCNDSRKPLGSRVDRHENIGAGLIGKVAFQQLMNDSRFEHVPILLETPDLEKHAEDLKLLRRFISFASAGA